MPIQNIHWKTSRERWTIETGGERESVFSVLAARHNDDHTQNIFFESGGGVLLLYRRYSHLKLCNELVGIRTGYAFPVAWSSDPSLCLVVPSRLNRNAWVRDGSQKEEQVENKKLKKGLKWRSCLCDKNDGLWLLSSLSYKLKLTARFSDLCINSGLLSLSACLHVSALHVLVLLSLLNQFSQPISVKVVHRSPLPSLFCVCLLVDSLLPTNSPVYMQKRRFLFPDFRLPKTRHKKWLPTSLPETLKEVIIKKISRWSIFI